MLIFRSARTSCTAFDWCARPCARISSPPSVLSPPVVVVIVVVVVVVVVAVVVVVVVTIVVVVLGGRSLANDHPEGPASCK